MSKDLRALLTAATGADSALDKALAEKFGVVQTDYSASIDHCISLLRQVLPGWTWHLGWNAAGLFPYAMLHRDHDHASSDAPTMPLALLRAIVKAHAGELDVVQPAPELPPWRRPAVAS